MTGIELDPEVVKDIVRVSILKTLDDGARERIIGAALDHLVTPRRESWQREATTPLEEAFKTAVFAAARKVVSEMIDNDPRVQQAIRDLLSPTLMAICEGNHEGLPTAIGEAFGEWLREAKR